MRYTRSKSIILLKSLVHASCVAINKSTVFPCAVVGSATYPHKVYIANLKSHLCGACIGLPGYSRDESKLTEHAC
jgi:hypothetical protein